MRLRRLFITCPNCEYFQNGEVNKYSWAKNHIFCVNCGYKHIKGPFRTIDAMGSIEWETTWTVKAFYKEIQWWNIFSWLKPWTRKEKP